jgi:hypothetical protein
MAKVERLVDPAKACVIVMECSVPMAHLPFIRAED